MQSASADRRTISCLDEPSVDAAGTEGTSSIEHEQPRVLAYAFPPCVPVIATLSEKAEQGRSTAPGTTGDRAHMLPSTQKRKIARCWRADSTFRRRAFWPPGHARSCGKSRGCARPNTKPEPIPLVQPDDQAAVAIDDETFIARAARGYGKVCSRRRVVVPYRLLNRPRALR
jgi:hypothetical protein